MKNEKPVVFANKAKQAIVVVNSFLLRNIETHS